MSIQAMVWVIDHSVARGSDRLVLLAIANHSDAVGLNAWPSIERIAEEARVHRATVHRCVTNLVALGELVVTQRGGGRRQTNHYQVLMQKRSQDATVEAETVAPCDKTVASGDRNGRRMRPESSLTVLNRPSLVKLDKTHSAVLVSPEQRDSSTTTQPTARPQPKAPPRRDRLALRLWGCFPDLGYEEALGVVNELRAQDISDIVIDEGIGYVIERNDVHSPKFLVTVVTDWFRQRG